MRKKSVFRWLARTLSGKRAVSLSPAVWRTGLPAVDAKIEIAQKSVRPRYARLRELEPFVGSVRAHQAATRGSIPGIYQHSKRK
jgi:hypothetical protein